MAERETPAQGPPPSDLAGFPVRAVGPGATLYRAHRADRGPWWFGNDGGGRFDLPAPRGTCYTALDPESAVRERLGPVLGSRGTLPESTLDGVVVSHLEPPTQRQVADLQSRRAARFGATRELESTVPYAVPQRWARALDAAGYGGVAYGPRFTPGRATAVALFDDAGQRDWPVDPAPVPASTVPGVPAPLARPRLVDLTVVRPPRTRATRG